MKVCIAPKIEAPTISTQRSINTLEAQVIPAQSSRLMNGKPVAGKHQAAGILCYNSLAGRGSKQAQSSMWYAIPHDLDKLDMSLDELKATLDKLQVNHFWWSTWSCKSDRVSARVLFPLSHEVDYTAAIQLWWEARQLLLDAGVPATNALGASSTDGRAMDGRLFFLPSIPEDRTDPTWGGVVPCGVQPHVLDALPMLDSMPAHVDQQKEIAAWKSIFGSEPCPGATTGTGSSRAYTAASGAHSTSTKVHVDFATVLARNGQNVEQWIISNIQPGQSRNGSSIFDASLVWQAGEDITSYSTCSFHMEQDGSMWAHDFRSNTTYIHSNSYSAVWVPSQQPASSTNTTQSPQIKVKTYASTSQLVMGKYLPHVDISAWGTVLKAPWGSGKTQLLSFIVDQAKSRGERVISVVHRTTLADQQSSRLNLANYQNTNDYSGDLVICIDSLHKLQIDLFDPGDYMLILDEVEQMLKHTVTSTTMSAVQQSANYNLLQSLIVRCKHLVVADADYGTVAHQYFTSFDKPMEIRRVPDVLGPMQPVLQWAEKDAWRELLLRTIREGKKVAIYVESSEQAKIIAAWAELEASKRVLIVAAEQMQIADRREHISRINDIIQDVDVLVYTPSMGTGYSIDITNHFDVRFAWLADQTVTGEESLQGIARVRSPKSQVVYVYCKNKSATSSCRNPQQILAEIRAGRIITHALMCRHIPTFAKDGTMQINDDLAQLQAQYIAKIRSIGGDGGAKKQSVKDYCDAHGIAYVNYRTSASDAELSAAKQAVTDMRNAVRTGTVLAIQQAAEISHDEAMQIRIPRDMDQALSKKRASILHNYGDLESNTIDTDQTDKSYYNRVRLMAAVGLILEGKDAVVAHNDATRWSDNVARSPALTLTAKVCASLLREGGASSLQNEIVYDSDKVSNWIRKNLRLRSALASQRIYLDIKQPKKLWEKVVEDRMGYVGAGRYILPGSLQKHAAHQSNLMIQHHQSKSQVDLVQHTSNVDAYIAEQLTA